MSPPPAANDVALHPAHRLKKRSINLAGHATSVALEVEFWAVLEAMAAPQPVSLLIAKIDAGRGLRPLASACRIAALSWALAGGDKLGL